MPKQTRGFWVCDYCSATFDRPYDAHVHETQQCEQRASSGSHMAPQDAPSHHYEDSQPLRAVPLLDSDVLDHGLATADAVSCRNLELFESFEQVGLRCRLCAKAHRGAHGELSLPRSIASLADAVMCMADRHLRVCEWLPLHERSLLEQMMRTRMGQDGHWHAEEAHRLALVEYCKARCFQLGMTNRYPEHSGIAWTDTDTAAPAITVTHAPTLQQSPIRQPQPQHNEITAAPSFDGRNMQPPPQESYHAVEQAHAGFAPPYHQGLSPMRPPMEAETQGIFRNTSFELPSNFPFFQDPYDGDWLCKYCSHVHPQYRDAHYRWSTQDRTPPPGDFIDHHLAICRMYLGEQQQQQQQMADYYHAPPPPHPPPHYGYGPPPPVESSYESANYSRAAAAAAGPLPPNVHPHGYPYDMPSASLSPGRSHHPHHNPQHQPQEGVMEETALRAAHYLASHDRFAQFPDDEKLVREEDKLLLTDFLYYLMKQLQVVRFSEADRKTRGGKRENINVGYGGLECVHCSESTKSRKFYWSGVDRLANSFAEIPSHVFKCKDCPDAVKNALTALKEVHPEQMARLPRGSQKVFFRRVWKRMHDEDPDPATCTATAATTQQQSPKPPPKIETSSNPVSPTEDTKQTSPTNTTGTIGSEDSVFVMERPTREAAQALADLARQTEPTPPSPSSRVLLAIAEDRDFLSDQDCFIRRQLEVFCATHEDVRIAQEDLKYPIQQGQVGMRCIHCSLAKSASGARGSGVVYPYSIGGIFEAVREFQRVHLEACEHFPVSWKSKLENMKESATISSIQRKYYSLAAKGLGLQDTREGIRAGAESVPVVAQAVFTFSDKEESWTKLHAGEQEQVAGSEDAYQHLASSVPSSKRKGDDHYEEPDSKRLASGDYSR